MIITCTTEINYLIRVTCYWYPIYILFSRCRMWGYQTRLWRREISLSTI